MTLSAEDLVVHALDRSDTERGYYFHARTSEAATRFTSAAELPDAECVVIALFFQDSPSAQADDAMDSPLENLAKLAHAR